MAIPILYAGRVVYLWETGLTQSVGHWVAKLGADIREAFAFGWFTISTVLAQRWDDWLTDERVRHYRLIYIFGDRQFFLFKASIIIHSWVLKAALNCLVFLLDRLKVFQAIEHHQLISCGFIFRLCSVLNHCRANLNIKACLVLLKVVIYSAS